MRKARKHLPLARSQRLLVEEVGSEKVVFDEESKEAHCLAPLASVLFAHSDGETSISELAQIATSRLGEPISEQQVQDALAQLEERQLLSVPVPIRISRREMVRKSAAVGVGAMVVTLISTVEPPMAQAFSCTSKACSSSAQCTGGTGCSGGQTCSRCSTFSHQCRCQ